MSHTMAFIGVAPFGSLVAGYAATKIGAPGTVMAGGAICMIVAYWFSRRLPEIRKLVRPIYVRLGILPEVAKGIEAADALRTPPE